MSVTASSSFQGPLPPPEMLAEYDKVVPNGAERIFTSFERQLEHRIDIEKTVLRGDQRRADRGLQAGVGIALAFLLAAIGLAMSGHETVAAVIGGADIAGMATTYVVGTVSRRGERREKAQLMSGGR